MIWLLEELTSEIPLCVCEMVLFVMRLLEERRIKMPPPEELVRVLLETVLLDEESSSLMPNVAMSCITICVRMLSVRVLREELERVIPFSHLVILIFLMVTLLRSVKEMPVPEPGPCSV